MYNYRNIHNLPHKSRFSSKMEAKCCSIEARFQNILSWRHQSNLYKFLLYFMSQWNYWHLHWNCRSAEASLDPVGWPNHIANIYLDVIKHVTVDELSLCWRCCECIRLCMNTYLSPELFQFLAQCPHSLLGVEVSRVSDAPEQTALDCGEDEAETVATLGLVCHTYTTRSHKATKEGKTTQC